MPTDEKPNLIRLLFDLKDNEEAQHRLVEGSTLEPGLALLRAWQSERLGRTYADFLEDKQFGPACRFFQTDIYAARDFSQRDHDLERLYKLLARYLPAHMMRLMRQLIELNDLTNHLDRTMVSALINDLGVTDTLSAEQYAEGYRICNQYTDRKQQITLLLGVIHEVVEGARFPLTGPTIKLIRAPAYAAGWSDLYTFLDRAYTAFRPIRSPQVFLGAVKEREMQILDRIFAQHPDPFGTP